MKNILVQKIFEFSLLAVVVSIFVIGFILSTVKINLFIAMMIISIGSVIVLGGIYFLNLRKKKCETIICIGIEIIIVGVLYLYLDIILNLDGSYEEKVQIWSIFFMIIGLLLIFGYILVNTILKERSIKKNKVSPKP